MPLRSSKDSGDISCQALLRAAPINCNAVCRIDSSRSQYSCLQSFVGKKSSNCCRFLVTLTRLKRVLVIGSMANSISPSGKKLPSSSIVKYFAVSGMSIVTSRCRTFSMLAATRIVCIILFCLFKDAFSDGGLDKKRKLWCHDRKETSVVVCVPSL